MSVLEDTLSGDGLKRGFDSPSPLQIQKLTKMIKVHMTYKSLYGGWSVKELIFKDAWHMMAWRRKWLGKYEFDQFNIVETKGLTETEIKIINSL